MGGLDEKGNGLATPEGRGEKETDRPGFPNRSVAREGQSGGGLPGNSLRLMPSAETLAGSMTTSGRLPGLILPADGSVINSKQLRVRESDMLTVNLSEKSDTS